MTALGAPALWFALLMAIGAALLSAIGTRPRRAPWRAAGAFALCVSLGGSLVSLVALGSALVARDFSLRYVASFTGRLMSRQAALSALWAGPAGVALCLAVAAGACAVLALALHRRDRVLQPAAVATLALLVGATLVAVQMGGSPFVRLNTPPAEGRGLHPQLRHAAMLLQTPCLLLGLAMLVVPFAYTVSFTLQALGIGSQRGVDASSVYASWRRRLQQWLVAVWLLLTVAITTGLWWAQQQLGWFGYFFSWEPYASAPMLPWLAVTALLLVLVSEVDRASGAWWLAGFMAFTGCLGVASLVRLRGGLAASIRAVDATPSLLLISMAGIGILLTGVLGFVAARATNRGRAVLGGLVLLVGALLAAVGVTGSYWRRDRTHALDTGEVMAVTDPFGRPWRFTSQGLSSYEERDHTVFAVGVMAMRDGARVGLLNSRQRQYFDANGTLVFEPSTSVGAAQTWTEAVSLAFLGPVNRTAAAVRISFVPLVALLWLGAALSCVGLALAAWPTRTAVDERRTRPEPATATAA
jgi:cytochrome c biogenesis factor